MVESVKFSPVNFQASLLSNVKNTQPTENKPEIQPSQIDERSGAEALSNYNRANVNPPTPKQDILKQYEITPSEVKPLPKDFTTKPKVLNSSGYPDYYEERNGDISTIYRTIDGGDSLSTVIEVNNKNGNKIREDIYDEKGNPVSVVEYNPETGIRRKYTSYDLDAPHAMSVLIFDDKGDMIKSALLEKDGSPILVNIKDKGCDGGCNTSYSYTNGQLQYKRTEAKDGTPLEITRYGVGKPVQTFVPVQAPVINTTNFDYKTLEYLKPSAIGNIETDISKLDGAKKFRSNNTLEEVTIQDGNINRTYILDETGNKIKEIKDTENGVKKRTIFYNRETNTINDLEEYFTDGDTKKVKVTYFDNGKPDAVAEYITDNKGRETRNGVLLYEDGKPRAYSVENKADNYFVDYTLNKNGDLIDIREMKKEKLLDEYYHETIGHTENIADKPGAADAFKKALEDPAWKKVYIKDRNVVAVSYPNMMDGACYDIFPNGTVYTYSGWGSNYIIMNSNEETANVFNQYKNRT